MRIRVRCTEVIRGDGWQHVQFITDNDGSVDAWHRETPTSKFSVPITTTPFFDKFEAGKAYAVDFIEEALADPAPEPPAQTPEIQPPPPLELVPESEPAPLPPVTEDEVEVSYMQPHPHKPKSKHPPR